MEYTTLSGTGLTVSRLGLGCEQLGGTDWGHVDESSVKAAVIRALDLGISLFDTADVYGLGRSETILSEVLGARRHEVVIVSKFGIDWQCQPQGGRARTFVDASPRRVVEALESSLRRLRLDSIPLYLIHWPDPHTPLADTLEALQRCQQAGKIQHIGVSNFPAQLIQAAHDRVRLSAVELSYSLIERQAELEVLPLCWQLGISVLTYGILGQGLLTGKYGADARFDEGDRRHRLPQFRHEAMEGKQGTLQRLRSVGARYQKTPAQVAIRWVLDAGNVACAIVGAKSPAQVEQNTGAAGWCLTPEDWHFLTDQQLLHAEDYPSDCVLADRGEEDTVH